VVEEQTLGEQNSLLQQNIYNKKTKHSKTSHAISMDQLTS